MDKTTIILKGLHCDACERVTIKRLEKISGISKVTSKQDKKTFEVEASKKLSKSEIEYALNDTPYTVETIH